MTRSHALPGAGLVLIAGAFAAFATANIIHNDFGLDPAMAPATLFVGLLFWRRHRALLLAAAVVMALPAFSFLNRSELSSPTDALHFLNHLALLLAGVLAVAAAIVTLVPLRRAVLQP
jgi:hypothetical protein